MTLIVAVLIVALLVAIMSRLSSQDVTDPFPLRTCPPNTTSATDGEYDLVVSPNPDAPSVTGWATIEPDRLADGNNWVMANRGVLLMVRRRVWPWLRSGQITAGVSAQTVAGTDDRIMLMAYADSSFELIGFLQNASVPIPSGFTITLSGPNGSTQVIAPGQYCKVSLTGGSWSSLSSPANISDNASVAKMAAAIRYTATQLGVSLP